MNTRNQLFRLFLIIFCCSGASAKPASLDTKNPKTTTLSGYIRDSRTGEYLSGAFIYHKDNPIKGVSTNSYGYFSLLLSPGLYDIAIQFAGYKTKIVSVGLKDKNLINVDLEEQLIALSEVIVTGDKNNNARSANIMSKVNVREIGNIPIIFGEKDILKTIQLLPGISPVGEGNSGFYVRGGGADQNLILLEDAPVYNPSHLLGFFSTFTSEAIKDVTVYKGAFPSEFGGRLSSVVDIKMNEGNNKNVHVSGGIGIISSRLSIEGPLLNHKGSFMICARRTYADQLLKLLPDNWTDSSARKTTLYFYDLNLKVNYKLSEKDHLYFSSYLGRDNFNIDSSLGLNWGNITATTRWNHIVSNKLFSNTSLIFSSYSYNFKVKVGNKPIQVLSQIKDWNLKEDLHYYLNSKNLIKFGFNSIHHTFVPVKVDSVVVFDLKATDNRYALESAFYISIEQSLSKHLKATYGLRYSLFSSIGPGTICAYNNGSDSMDSVSYPKGRVVNTFGGLEPRFHLNYILNDSNSIKASYARNRQYIHLLSNTTTSTPFDLWIPSNINILPGIADQYTLGYFRNFGTNMFEMSVELYYKKLQNQIDYRNGADLMMNTQLETQLVFGKGLCYGAEFYLRKKYGRLTGWVSYTLSKTQRQFEAINGGKAFLAKQDRPNNISIVGMYQINPQLNFSATWVYYNGNAVTFPNGSYVVEDNVVPLYTNRNGYRMPDYHRLDIGLTLNNKKNRRFKSAWNFSVYNVYARENAYAINFRADPKDASKMQTVQLSLFRFIPSVTYNFNF